MFASYFRLILLTPHSDLDASSVKNRKIALFYKHVTIPASIFVSALFLTIPHHAHAGFFSFVGDIFAADKQTPVVVEQGTNSQNIPLLQASSALDVGAVHSKNADISIVVEKTALSTETGPLGSMADSGTDDLTDAQAIDTYIVRKGDTISKIADLFNISSNTILWANDLKKGQALTEGQTLVILPVSGVQYTVKKKDTLKGIAKVYKADVQEIAQFNGITDDKDLVAGVTILIPDGDATPVRAEKETKKVAVKQEPKIVAIAPKTIDIQENDDIDDHADDAQQTEIKPTSSGYYIRPIVGGRKSQGLHGSNGIDLAAPIGTPLMAAASGKVIVARTGWNGGYGNYVVIAHDNGSQTLYGHMKSISVQAGDIVAQGDNIGQLGNTGKSTGPHVHFEVRGAKNPGGVKGAWDR